ncbi:hypothetical protein ACFLYR_01920 [Chloroflexota bacterium]
MIYPKLGKGLLFIGLVLIMLLTQVITIGPLSARAAPDTDAWNKYHIPEEGEAGGWVLTSDVSSEATGVTAIAVAFDGTIYAATKEIDGSPLSGYNLFRSNDDGYTWEPLWKIPAGDNPSGDAEIMTLVLPDREDADTLYLATRHNIYQSTDGGERFTSLGRPALDEGALIASFDVSDFGGARLVVVGTRDTDEDDYGGVYFYDESQPFTPWADLRVGNAPAGTKYDVVAVALSPNFADDEQVVSVVTDETDTILTTKLGDNVWGADVGDAYLLDPTSTPPFGSWAATGGSLAFPANYDSDVAEDKYTQYVGIKVESDTGDTGGMYMIMGFEAPDDSIAVPLYFPAPVHSIAAAGEAYGTYVVIGEGFDPTVMGIFTPAFAIAGLTDGRVVSIATGAAYTPPSAAPATDACVAIGAFHGSAYYVYAGTSGINGGFARSVDTGATFARTGLICDDLETIADMTVSPGYNKDGTMYIITEGHSQRKILWRTTDRGQTWDAVLTEGFEMTSPNGDTATVGAFDKVILSRRFASDTAVFLGEPGSEPDIWRSVDNGFRFARLPSKTGTAGTIDSLVAAGLKEVMVGDSQGDFYRTTNSGLTWSTAVATGLNGFSSMVLSPDYGRDQTILAGDDEGNVCRSTDAGEEWQSVTEGTEKFDKGENVYVAFHPDYASNGTFFAAGDNKAGTDGELIIARYGDEWEVIYELEDSQGVDIKGNATGLTVSEDGTLYCTFSGVDGMFRTLNPMDRPDKVEVENVTEDITTALASLYLSAGSNILSGQEGYYDSGTGEWTPGKDIYTYADTLNVSPQLDSPADGADSGRQTSCQLSWQEISSATSYEIWYDTAPSFNQSPTRLYSEVTHADITGLESGVTYYWRVRVGQQGDLLFAPDTFVASGAPAFSRFSGTRSFTTTLGRGQWSPFAAPSGIAPLPGAIGVSVRPTFHWEPADGATAYELVLARNSEFTDVVIAMAGDNVLLTNVWASDRDLEYSTTYYWRVRAVSPTSYSQWAVGIFTTQSAALVPPSPSPSPPVLPTEPGTPVAIWVMLAVIAVLIIVLLVLIVTTRRSY